LLSDPDDLVEGKSEMSFCVAIPEEHGRLRVAKAVRLSPEVEILVQPPSPLLPVPEPNELAIDSEPDDELEEKYGFVEFFTESTGVGILQ
jgi:hypothetical protein